MQVTDRQNLSSGKYRRMNRLCNADGQFAMLAIDQRQSLQKMISRQMGCDPEKVGGHELGLVKRIITRSISPLSTAVLTCPEYGYPGSLEVISPSIGVILSSEVTGYDLRGKDERLSRLMTGWDVEQPLKSGADAVKLLIWHHPDTTEATHQHQQEIVQRVGEACSSAQMPFVLEIVVYGLNGQDTTSADFARVKPRYVLDAARTYSNPKFAVDLLKLQFPGELKFTEEYQSTGYGTGFALYDRSQVRQYCTDVDAACAVPWVILSAGVGIGEFTENIRLANKAGASGFLCGRAVWKNVIDFFPHKDQMQQYADETGCRYFESIRQANHEAVPWQQH
ncbi:MAG: tagatose 1,6-diphosphate aldolase [Balneolales bacterium]